jgi:hypothetical protein
MTDTDKSPKNKAPKIETLHHPPWLVKVTYTLKKIPGLNAYALPTMRSCINENLMIT